jgi:hypothetical protein
MRQTYTEGRSYDPQIECKGQNSNGSNFSEILLRVYSQGECKESDWDHESLFRKDSRAKRVLDEC